MRLLWTEVADLPLSELQARLQHIAKQAGSVTVADLVAPSPGASTGLYVFFDRERCLYVGSARSRALIERLPAHFDTRPEGWFGTLLKYLAQSSNTTPHRVVDSALGMRVAIIFKDTDRGDILKAETALRHAFRPQLNTPKRRLDVGATLAEVAL